VSLGRFQNCNSLEMDNVRLHGVEDKLEVQGDDNSTSSTPLVQRGIQPENVL
jgi:hypothetical protein